MALGFGPTQGAGTTDSLTAPSTPFDSSISLLVRFVQLSELSGAGDRLWDIFSTSTGVGSAFLAMPSSAEYRISVFGSVATTTHLWGRPAFGTPVTLSVSIPDGSPNTPTVVQNCKQMVVTTSGSSVWTKATYNTINIGNRSEQDRCWNGNFQDFALYNAVLTFGELMAFQNGVSPLKIRPDRLEHYMPFSSGDPLRNLAPKPVSAWTVTGTAYTGGQVFPHFERNRSIFLPTWVSVADGVTGVLHFADVQDAAGLIGKSVTRAALHVTDDWDALALAGASVTVGSLAFTGLDDAYTLTGEAEIVTGGLAYTDTPDAFTLSGTPLAAGPVHVFEPHDQVALTGAAVARGEIHLTENYDKFTVTAPSPPLPETSGFVGWRPRNHVAQWRSRQRQHEPE